MPWALRGGSGLDMGQQGSRGLLAEGTAETKAQRHESTEQSVVPSAQRDRDMERHGGHNIKEAGPNLAGP